MKCFYAFSMPSVGLLWFHFIITILHYWQDLPCSSTGYCWLTCLFSRCAYLPSNWYASKSWWSFGFTCNLEAPQTIPLQQRWTHSGCLPNIEVLEAFKALERIGQVVIRFKATIVMGVIDPDRSFQIPNAFNNYQARVFIPHASKLILVTWVLWGKRCSFYTNRIQ